MTWLGQQAIYLVNSLRGMWQVQLAPGEISP